MFPKKTLFTQKVGINPMNFHQKNKTLLNTILICIMNDVTLRNFIKINILLSKLAFFKECILSIEHQKQKNL